MAAMRIVTVSLLVSSLVASIEGLTPSNSQICPKNALFITRFHVLPNENGSAVDINEQEMEEEYEEKFELLQGQEAVQDLRDDSTEDRDYHHKFSKSSKWKKKRYCFSS